MSRVTPELTRLATRLLLLETRKGPQAGRAAVRVCEKLGRVLGVFLGAAGFRALLVRALSLAMPEAPELKTVQVKADGSLEGLNESEATSGKDKFTRGESLLVAHLLGLLLTFIGEPLMLRLVHDAWPKARLEALGTHDGDDR